MDKIEKSLHLKAPRSRVWRALTDSTEFGKWFGVRFEHPFAAGTPIQGRLTIAAYANVKFEFVVDKIEPESYFSYRWHPYAVNPAIDYSTETPTLVEFRLTESDGGTLLEITESGFEKLPANRRAEAFRMNDGGWQAQARNIERHVSEA